MVKKLANYYRHWTQLLVTFIANSYVMGFFSGKIFTGNSKYVCVPGLNCYSCPGALGSCPIGAYQAVVGGRKHSFSFYVMGFLIFFGVSFARLICGFLCPFGFLQDLLYKVPLPFGLKTQKQKATKIKIPTKIDKIMRSFKYFVLAIPVMLLPVVLANQFGIGDPYFCKYLCPVGMLQGAIPLVSQNETLQAMLGFLFNWKAFLLIFFIISSIVIYRPFCKYLCPLGAFYGFFNRFSLYKMDVKLDACTHCGACEKACHMQVNIFHSIQKDKVKKSIKACEKIDMLPINSNECIRCGDCVKACPQNCISSGFKL